MSKRPRSKTDRLRRKVLPPLPLLFPPFFPLYFEYFELEN